MGQLAIGSQDSFGFLWAWDSWLKEKLETLLRKGGRPLSHTPPRLVGIGTLQRTASHLRDTTTTTTTSSSSSSTRRSCHQ